MRHAEDEAEAAVVRAEELWEKAHAFRKLADEAASRAEELSLNSQSQVTLTKPLLPCSQVDALHKTELSIFFVRKKCVPFFFFVYMKKKNVLGRLRTVSTTCMYAHVEDGVPGLISILSVKI